MTDEGRIAVMLATDGEGPALRAEELLTSVADRSKVEVVAACVSTFDMCLQETENLHLSCYSPEAGARHARAMAEAAVARLEAAGFSARPAVLEGDAPTELLDLAQRQPAGLAVLGAGHRRWREAPMLGRTCRVVLHEAPCSVLVVHRCEPAVASRTVLVTTDGSAGAEQAVRAFSSVADPARCTVVVASVTRTPAPGAVDHAEPTPVAEHQTESAESAVAEAAMILEKHGFACRTEVVRGHPGRTLLDLAEQAGSSMIVAGSRGLGRLRRLALGSVSDALARYANAALIGRATP